MIRTSGGPSPTTRYPTGPSAVCATCAVAEVTETVVAVGGDELQAASAAVSAAAVSPAAIRRPRAAPLRVVLLRVASSRSLPFRVPC